MSRVSPARHAALRYLSGPSSRYDARRRTLLAELDARDRGLFLELTAGTVKRRVTLDCVLAAYVKAGPSGIQAALLEVLRLALYQLLFLERVPAHAVVHEAVELAGQQRGRGARGFVNGVLRSVLRGLRFAADDTTRRADGMPLGDGRVARFDRPVLPDPRRDEEGWRAAAAGLTVEALRLLAEGRSDQDLDLLLGTASSPPVITLRRNATRASADELASSLGAEGIEVEPVSDHPAPMLLWTGGGDPSRTDAFRRGAITVQGLFAARVAPFFDLPTDARVLDVCAPPGGKTVHLAEGLTHGSVTAMALDEAGAARIRANAERLGLASRVHVRVGRELPTEPFDAVLLDVPCSNSGVLGRRPEARHRLAAAPLASLVRIQRALLENVLSRVIESGRSCLVVYATCSILDQENLGLVRRTIAAYDGVEPGPALSASPTAPHRDGGFAVRLVVRAGARRREAPVQPGEGWSQEIRRV